MKLRKQSGFTLIELLVVIAIIAILSTIILVSLKNTKERARNARMLSQIRSMREQADLFYLNQSPPSYGASRPFVAGAPCLTSGVATIFGSTDPNSLKKFVALVASENGNYVSCASNVNNWVFAAWLPYYREVVCVDSNGVYKRVGIAPNQSKNLLSAMVDQSNAQCK